MALISKSIAVLLGAAAMAAALSGTARADTNSVMSGCSTQYKADKAAGKVPADQTWPQYYSTCAAKAKTDAASTTGTAAATTAKPTTAATTATTTATTTTTAKTTTAATTTATTAATTTAKPTTAATTADTSGANSSMSTCSAQYKADKAANKVPAGQTWPQYYSACAANLKASTAASTSTTDAADAPPPEPTATSVSAATSTTDANGKALTPGQIAARARIKQCGAMWQSDKAASKIPAGQTWPKYWSACNTKLKAAGN